MTNFENQRSGDQEIDDVDGFWDGLADIFEARERGERILQFLQAMDLQVMGACRADERLKPLLKLNVSCDAAEDRLLAHLSQHFEPSEVGLLARCLCLPLVSIRVGNINKQGTLLCPTSTRGNLNLTLLPTSDLRISFTGDDGRTKRLVTLTSVTQCSDIAVEQISLDTSGRSFLLKVPDDDVFYFWCSEKSKLLGNELLMKLKDLLKKKPTLAELTGISNSRLDYFATYLRAYLGSSLSTTRAVSAASPSDTSDLFEFRRAAKSSPSPSPSKTSHSRNIANQSHQVSLSPRSGSFIEEGSSRNLSLLKRTCLEKPRRRDNPFSTADNLSSDSPVATDTKEQLSDSSEELISPSFLCPGSQVTSLASSLLSPYYCWCSPIASTLQYTVSPPQLSSLSSIESLPLPPLSSLLTPPPENTDTPKLDFPPLFPEPLMQFPFPRSNSYQIATFTPLMCDPIVHIPVIDVCSSGPGYLISAESVIPPLHPKLGNNLIPESDPDVEKGARETLRLLISGSTQTNPQLMNVLPSVFTAADERCSIFATGVLANSFVNLELVSIENVTKKTDASKESSVEKVRKFGSYGDNDCLSNLED